MRKLLPLLGLLLSTSAFAADNALIVTPGAGVTMRTIDVGALVQAGTSVPVGINGAVAWGTAGVANANILTVQGIASMTPILVTATQSGTWNIGTVTTVTAVTSITNPVAATQSGTWTVQPGNTANSTAWLVTGTGGTFPSTAAVSTYVDGWDITQGTKADAVCASATANTCSVIAMLKFIANASLGPIATQSSTVPIGGVSLLAPSSNTGCTGATPIISTASNNATQIKGSAGILCSLDIQNTSASLASVRFYDTATAPSGGAPCNSTTGVARNVAAQANTVSPGAVLNLGPYGQGFANGIVVCVTGANANNDNTNAPTGVNVNITWK